MSCKVAYLLAAFGGVADDNADRTVYLYDHLEKLKTVKHSLDAIILLINTDETNARPELLTYTAFVNTIPEVINDTPLIIIRRPNIGISYGAYALAFDIYVNDFDYFIMMEDDYMPMEDNFDTTLISMLEEAPNTALLCGCIAYGFGGGDDPHAGLSNGIISSKVVKQVQESGGFKFSNKAGDCASDESLGQVTFSQSVLPFGEITDITHRYPLIFYHTHRQTLVYKAGAPVLLAPHQYLGRA